MADRAIKDLDPALQPLAIKILMAANSAIAPSKVAIIVTWRNAQDQQAAKAKGLSKASFGESPHQRLPKSAHLPREHLTMRCSMKTANMSPMAPIGATLWWESSPRRLGWSGAEIGRQIKTAAAQISTISR